MPLKILLWLAGHGADVWSDGGLRVHELRPAPDREIYVHRPARRTQSPLAARAIEIADELAERDLGI